MNVRKISFITDDDVYLFKEGNHFKLYEKLGARICIDDGTPGTYFAVWAPNASTVSVTGDFNGWNNKSHRLYSRSDSSGIWEGFIPGIGKGDIYKYHIKSHYHNYRVSKADPFALLYETPPKTASVIWDLNYKWDDAEWMGKRHAANSIHAPMSIYEIHIGSWRKVPEDGNRPLTYREMADYLPDYVSSMGFTHVEFLPVTEHPFYGSWGYQSLGYFAPTSRYGTPQDFMYLIDSLHKHNIGVIFDWVPSHFPGDEHGLSYFDGTHLYEHSDPKQGFHPDWKSYIFNHDRYEVRAFLVSSAIFWFDKFHIDGLRVDAVASMLYLDYSRENGEWVPNHYGGRENLGAIYFLRRLNEAVYSDYPDVQMIAEESSAWPMVSRPTYVGGLGFGMKWNMGWMHDTLEYFTKDPIHRKHHHNQLTFSIWYAFFENFLLPLSHDEVVFGKGSLIGKMPGDYWQKFANLRLLFGYMYGHSGKKLLFMGGEFAQWSEWYHETSLDWNLLEYEKHQQIQRWVQDLNRLYRAEPAMYELDADREGFEWVDFSDWEGSIISFIRKGRTVNDLVLVICNFTPVTRTGYKIGVPREGFWKEVLNSDSSEYGGSNNGNSGGVNAGKDSSYGHGFSVSLTIPPLAVIFMKHSG